ncbi:MAG: hypothetical protein PWQ54_430 [Bacteroidales bacterium]|jgi:hypothetical protein|nr:hypothetical protein [Bacteroidales bacterium]
MAPKKTFPKQLWWLLIISFVIRAFLAAWIELGNDEVYYWTYALYPDWSHFDHPPMVGWMIQLFSLNLLFDSELFLRLSSVVLMTINTFLIYLIGTKLRDSRTGFYASLLYTASIYAFVITGIFILPDTPQNFFWLLSLWSFIQAFTSDHERKQHQFMLLAGIFTGLAMLSKYTSVFLWFGVVLYILIDKQKWLKKWSLYVAILFSILLLAPVLFWNLQNDFVSFSFQSERVGFLDSSLRPDLFFTELAGQFIYNNPVNVVLIILSLVAMYKAKKTFHFGESKLLICIAFPLIGIFLFFALFRATLPHWTSPAYNTLIFFAAARLAEKQQYPGYKIPKSIQTALVLLIVVLLLGSLQIKFALIPIADKQAYHQLGKNDVTLDMFGWRGMDKQFKSVVNKHIKSGEMSSNDGIISNNWFPMSHIDYYIARPLQMTVLGLGKPENLHKYMWINQKRGGFQIGKDYWYITNSRDYTAPQDLYDEYFRQIIPSDTLTVMRNGIPAKRYFVFLLKDLKKLPKDYLNQH